MGPHKNLNVWKKGIELVKSVYNATAQYPQTENFGLTSQMRRCAVSIPSNIAEGYGRETNKELVHFLYISLGSSNELDTQLIISHELDLLCDSDYDHLLKMNGEVQRMIHALIQTRTTARNL